MEPFNVDRVHELADQLSKLLFEVDANGWRSVYIKTIRPLPNEMNPDLAMVVFEVEPVVPTSFMPTLPGIFYLTEQGLRRERVSWIRPNTERSTTGFRPVTDEARTFLEQHIARAQGKRFSEHDLGGHVVYTRDP